MLYDIYTTMQPPQQVQPPTLQDLGKKIIEMSKSNPLYASIANESLRNIHGFLTSNERQEQTQTMPVNDPTFVPPQINQITPMMQPMMAQQMAQPMFGQSLLPPMMGNQMPNYMLPQTGNIPFLYHQQ